MYMLYLLVLSHCPWMSVLFLKFFERKELHFSLGIWYWPIFKFTDSFLAMSSLLINLSESILHLCYTVFDSFLGFVSFYAHHPSVLSYLLLFFIRDLNMLIVVILDILSDNSQICVIYESNSHAFFVSSEFCCCLTVCFCLLSCLVLFSWKPDMLYLLIGTEKLAFNM